MDKKIEKGAALREDRLDRKRKHIQDVIEAAEAVLECDASVSLIDAHTFFRLRDAVKRLKGLLK